MSTEQKGLTDAEVKGVAALRSELSKLPGDPAAGVADTMLVRFLRTQGGNPQKAADAYSNYLNWRKEKKLDTILEKPGPKTLEVARCISYAYHGFDKGGRPIYWEKTGKILCQALLASVTVDEFVMEHVWGFENLARKCEESSKKLNKPVDTFLSVLDLEGLSLNHRVAIPFLQACMAVDNKYYPQRVGKVIIINSPWIMPAMYKMIQVFLDEHTKSQIEIVYGDPKAELLKYIDKEVIPVEYGGESRDVFPTFSEAEMAPLLKLENPDYGLEKANVAAGAKLTKTLECGKEGAVFTWFFESEGKYDVDFKAEIEAEGKKTYAKMPSRCVTSKGSYTSDGPCKLTFEWDNSFSYINSKNIKYFLSVADKVDLRQVDDKGNPAA